MKSKDTKRLEFMMHKSIEGKGPLSYNGALFSIFHNDKWHFGNLPEDAIDAAMRSK